MSDALSDRLAWRKAFKKGAPPRSHTLDVYRKNRSNPTWRMSRAAEHLCEYIMYLEDEVKRLGADLEAERDAT